MDSVVGSCSLCGGPVTIPTVWMAVIPPVPRCAHCGAVAASHGPVIPMRPRPVCAARPLTPLFR